MLQEEQGVYWYNCTMLPYQSKPDGRWKWNCESVNDNFNWNNHFTCWNVNSWILRSDFLKFFWKCDCLLTFASKWLLSLNQLMRLTHDNTLVFAFYKCNKKTTWASELRRFSASISDSSSLNQRKYDYIAKSHLTWMFWFFCKDG